MSERTSDTYDATLFSRLSAVEDRHFWFVARNSLIAALISNVARAFPPGYRMLEIGCGNGSVLSAAQKVCQHGITFGTDLFLDGLKFATQRTSSPLVVSDIQSAPFGRAFHLLGLFDVLEHLDDDVAALRTASRVLAPGGSVLLTVPAHQYLWSYSDVAAHHRRRYSAASLRGMLERAGLEVEFMSYFMLGTIPAIWLKRKLLRRKAGSTPEQDFLAELRIGPVSNAIFRGMVSWEAAWVGRRRCLPTGSSLVAIARRTGVDV
jgi:SAM-dependent methyltransferase